MHAPVNTKIYNPRVERNGIQVIGRAAAILRSLEGEHEGLSLSEIAERVELPRSTVQRIVAALSEEKLLMSASANARVKLGPEIIRLASSAHIGIERIARPHMQVLSRAAEETVDLSVLKNDAVVFVEQVVGDQRLVAVSSVGATFPLHCTANGKAILAMLPLARRTELLGDRLRRFTESTLTDHKALSENLAAIQSSGIAVDLEEHSIGISAVGTAFLDPAGRECALSIPVPTGRFAAKRLSLIKLIKRTKADLVTELQSM